MRSLHESQKQYECSYCPQRFTSIPQAKLHRSVHLFRDSWSCPSSGSFQAVFYDIEQGVHNCGYCGEVFPTLKYISDSCMSESWSDRLEHLRTRHSFGYGNDGHIHAFHEVDEFKAHLIAYHRAILEPWTIDLEQFCRDKSTPGAISGEPR